MKNIHIMLVVAALTLACAGCASRRLPESPPSAPVVAPSVGQARSNQDELVLSRESLQAVKNEVPNGSIEVRKVIRTERVSVPIDLKTEGYEIVRVAPSGQSPDFSDKKIGMDLKKEVAYPVVNAQVVEVVRINKTTKTEPSSVQGQVRSESFEVVK